MTESRKQIALSCISDAIIRLNGVKAGLLAGNADRNNHTIEVTIEDIDYAKDCCNLANHNLKALLKENKKNS